MSEHKLTFTAEQWGTVLEVVRALREDFAEVDAATDEAECVTLALHDWVTSLWDPSDAGSVPAPVKLPSKQRAHMTREQISRWMEYYLCEFGKAARTHNHEYGEICWKRLFVLHELRGSRGTKKDSRA